MGLGLLWLVHLTVSLGLGWLALFGPGWSVVFAILVAWPIVTATVALKRFTAHPLSSRFVLAIAMAVPTWGGLTNLRMIHQVQRDGDCRLFATVLEIPAHQKGRFLRLPESAIDTRISERVVLTERHHISGATSSTSHIILDPIGAEDAPAPSAQAIPSGLVLSFEHYTPWPDDTEVTWQWVDSDAETSILFDRYHQDDLLQALRHAAHTWGVPVEELKRRPLLRRWSTPSWETWATSVTRAGVVMVLLWGILQAGRLRSLLRSRPAAHRPPGD
jgi:hypothetical protein